MDNAVRADDAWPEFSAVRTLVDVPDEGPDIFRRGVPADSIGTIVEIYMQPHLAYEVEFANPDGRTWARRPFTPAQLELLP